MYYHQKLIISGAYFEHYKYGKSLKRDFTRKKKEKVEYEVVNVESLIDNGLDGVADDNKCSIDALSIKTNVGNITVETVGIMDDDYNPF